METVLFVLSAIFWVVIALSILVFVHEMGHFLAARLFKMRVDAFSIGFPPTIFRKKVGETEYQLGAVPLGGYVKIAGMVDESMDTEFAEAEPQPDEFRAKPVWQRIVVITGGVIFNFIFAGLIYAALAFVYGDAYVPAEGGASVYVADSSLAAEMGLQTGDRILAVNGEPIERLGDIDDAQQFARDPFTVTVSRDGEELTLEGPERMLSRLSAGEVMGLSVLPALAGGVERGSPAALTGLQRGDQIVGADGEAVQFWGELVDRVQAAGTDGLTLRWSRPDSLAEGPPARGEEVARTPDAVVYEARVTPRYNDEAGIYQLGVAPPDADLLSARYGTVRETYGVLESVGRGASEAVNWTGFYFQFVGRLFRGKENVRDTVGGPVIIAKMAKQTADLGGEPFWRLVAMLSIALAVFNILPIPALDGGHLVFLIYEGITRREPSLKVRMVVQQIGFVVLLAFMAFVIFNDFTRL